MNQSRILKNRLLNILLIAVSIIAFSALLVSCGESEQGAGSTNNNSNTNFRTVDEIKASGTIKIGVFIDKSPFGYLDANGKNVGYDIYYGDQLATSLGVKAEYIPVDAAARVSSLESNKVDVILANFTVTPERAEKVDFTTPYMKVSLGLASHTDSPIESLEQASLEGKKIAIVKGTTAETYLEKTYPDVFNRALKYDQYAQVQDALTDNRADAWLTDNTEAIAFAKQNPNYVVPVSAASIGEPDSIAPAVAKDNETLLKYINENISEIASQNFFHKDYEATLLDVYGQEFEDQLVVEGEGVKEH